MMAIVNFGSIYYSGGLFQPHRISPHTFLSDILEIKPIGSNMIYITHKGQEKHHAILVRINGIH
ncbi:hypothetical protein [Bacteroides clarus]|uniref:hypothetical protein n=1 Tax=Bacteroides clarus TaxID=626929 RepID=UPI001896F3C6|nr:hypothetical protein [Bacteroides clarus]